MIKKEIVKYGLTMLVVGVIAATGLGFTYAVTKDKIAEQDRLSEAKAGIEAMPGITSPDELTLDEELTARAKEAVPEVQKVYVTELGTVITVEQKGYGGPMVLAVGINGSGAVVGMASVSNRETVGLGSRALVPEFFERFMSKSASDPLEVGEDIDAVSGATISSKAVTAAVKTALEAYERVR